MIRVFPWPAWTANPYLGRLSLEMQRSGIQIVHRSSWRLGLRELREGDWVHLHWPGAKVMSPLRWWYRLKARRFLEDLDALRRRRVRIAWTAHNLLPHDDPHPDLGHEAREAMLRRVQHVFVHFEAARSLIAHAFGYRGDVTVVPHGNYCDEYPWRGARAEARRRLGLPEAGFVVLMLGELRPYKRISLGIEAFCLVAGPEDRLVVAGRPERKVLREIRRSVPDHRVVLIPRRMTPEEVGLLHEASDGVLMAHQGSFTSGSAVLALSLGCPVVGPPTPHLLDLGPEPRVFVAGDSTPKGLAEALVRRRLAGEVEPKDLRQWARSRLSWDVVRERTSAVLSTPFQGDRDGAESR